MANPDELVTLVDHLPQIMDALEAVVAATIKDAAQTMADDYTSTAPRDTGHMASSVYVVTKDTTTYGAHVVGGGELLPSVDAPTNTTDATVAVAAPYAAYPEYGTAHAAAQPAFHPAFDRASQALEQALADLARKIADAAGVKS